MAALRHGAVNTLTSCRDRLEQGWAGAAGDSHPRSERVLLGCPGRTCGERCSGPRHPLQVRERKARGSAREAVPDGNSKNRTSALSPGCRENPSWEMGYLQEDKIDILLLSWTAAHRPPGCHPRLWRASPCPCRAVGQRLEMSLCSSGGDSRTQGTHRSQEKRAQPLGRRTFLLGWARVHGVSQELWSLLPASMSLKGPAPEGNPYRKRLRGLQRQELKEKLALPVFNWRQSLGSKLVGQHLGIIQNTAQTRANARTRALTGDQRTPAISQTGLVAPPPAPPPPAVCPTLEEPAGMGAWDPEQEEERESARPLPCRRWAGEPAAGAGGGQPWFAAEVCG